MALPSPNLDDRTFQQLVDDAKRMVQKRCPEWTDHNVSDPGVTLIETFAQMTEQLLYRLNQVPDRLYLRFLDLIGLRLLPPTAARVPVTFWLTSALDSPLVVPRATTTATAGSQAEEPVVFSTLEDLTIPPCRVRHLRRIAGPQTLPLPLPLPPPVAGGPETGEDTTDHTTTLELRGSFPAFSDPPRSDDQLLIGLDTAVPCCAVTVDFQGRIEGVGVDPRRPPLAWEAWDGERWHPCELSSDTTGGLNRTGSVILHVPREHRAALLNGVLAGWLRARVTAAEPGQPHYTASPVVRGLSVSTVGGTVAALNAEFADAEDLGVCEGVAGQRFQVPRVPVLAAVGTPVLEISSEAEGWQEWTEVDHFAESGPEDRHFQLDATAGEIRLGPAVRLPDGTLRHYGAVPDPGAAARLRGFATGGGSRGNVAAHAIDLLTSPVPFISRVDNLVPAAGGTEGESVAQARDRGPLLLRTRSRAVTADDFEFFARQAAPEAGRLRCLPADAPGDAPGAVRVLVVPTAHSEDGRIDLPALIPDRTTLDRIAARLDEVRLLGTRVVVEPPLYRGVTVVARLVARPRTDRARLREEALRALYTFLSPLPGGGPEGHGWPFGRPVQSGEVYAVLQKLHGVELVEDVRLFSVNPITGEHGGEQRRIHLEPNSMVFSHGHQVRVEAH
ncbi:putative baseplate assembly protein [Streptacidiphilus anmyonensis]|uniref:putative baseplate assembly protein n=1 Tax=Streptacidiphilus anmyonensis TaxID=405782 RepID=UPI0005AB1F3A|nr:putative baseplate assembly protein [Streptacidiphilus anmyonensis]